MENQLTILSESLDKLKYCRRSGNIISVRKRSFLRKKWHMSLFDDAVEEKQRLIDEVVRLDEGFEIL